MKWKQVIFFFCFFFFFGGGGALRFVQVFFLFLTRRAHSILLSAYPQVERVIGKENRIVHVQAAMCSREIRVSLGAAPPHAFFLTLRFVHY